MSPLIVVRSLLAAVTLLSLAVNAAPVRAGPAAPDYYYEPIVPYGPYPAPGYVVSTYLPSKYAPSYHIVAPVSSYRPPKTEYDADSQYENDDPKYYYGGKFRGICLIVRSNHTASITSPVRTESCRNCK